VKEDIKIQGSDLNEMPEIKEREPFNTRRLEEQKNEKRLSRASTSRRESRTSEERPPIVFGGGSRFNLPQNIIKKLQDNGKVLGFVVYSSGNVEQKENYDTAIERGWKPLDSREFPELSRQYELSPFGTREEDYLIKRGGQVAMVRDKEIDDAERDYYDSEKQRQEYMASMYKTSQSDPRLPKPFIDQRTRHSGRL
jgi:hypothetical protein